MLHVFVVFVVAVVLTTVSPQQSAPFESIENSIERNRNVSSTNTTTTPTTTISPIITIAAKVTSASSTYLSCFRSCLTTMQYNPVCGTDGIDYHNSGRLDCARRCGKDVNVRKLGICNSNRI